MVNLTELFRHVPMTSSYRLRPLGQFCAEGLIEHFSKLEDPRVDRNKKHELIDVVVLCVCAVLSGAEGWCDIEEFGRTKLDWLRRYVPLANGIPVDDTIARIISALSVKGFLSDTKTDHLFEKS